MRIFTWLFFVTLSAILMLQLRGFDSDLHTPDTPHGIVGYELAWSARKRPADDRRMAHQRCAGDG